MRFDRVLMSAYVDRADWERLKKIARDDDRSASALLRNFIRAGLAQYERQRAVETSRRRAERATS